MGQLSKKNRGSSKAAGGGNGAGTGSTGSRGTSSVCGSSPPMRNSPATAEAKQDFETSSRESNLWGRLFSRSGRSLLHNEHQASATRSHAPSPPTRKTRETFHGGETGSAGGRNNPSSAADISKAAAPPRSAQPGAASGAEERKRKSQRDRGVQNYAGEKRHSDKHSLALGAYIKRMFSYDFRASFRSRLLGWVVNLAVAAAIIGIFALKAAEEFYGEDISRGAEREEHLTALQLDASANEMDIRRAYRTLSIRWHPDKNPDCPSCQARFTEVAAAYEFLMKDFRKQKEEQSGAAESPIGASSPLGEDEKRTERNDIVDFTYLSSSEPFYPSTDKQVWTIMLRNGKDEFSDRVYEMWEETALALGKYVKYGQVEVHKNKSIMKRLPVKVKIFPAIFVVSHGMHPELYPAIAHPSVEGIRSFISRSFPNHVSLISHASELQTYLSTTAPPFTQTPLGWLAQPYKVVVVPGAESPASPPVALKATAKKYRDVFSFAYVQNVRGLLLDGTDSTKNEFTSLLQSQVSSTSTCRKRQRSESPGEGQSETASGKAESETGEHKDSETCISPDSPDEQEHMLKFTEKDLKSYLTVILFVRETPGAANRLIERIRIPTLLSRRESQRVAFAKLPRVVTSQLLPRVHPYLYKQNAPLLCRGTPQERVFTLVLVEPPRVTQEAGSKTENGWQQQESSPAGQGPALYAFDGEQLTFGEAVALVEVSRTRYAQSRGSSRRVASEQQGSKETRDDRDEEHEAEDYAAESADEDSDANDTSFRLQIARISFDSPATLPALPGITTSSPFVSFWKNQLQSSPMFLLHLDGNRYALLSPPSVEDREGRQTAPRELLSELYQVLEKQVQQQHFESDGDYENDDDGTASGQNRMRLEWHPLPAGCDWTHFIKNCLPSAAAPWWWDLIVNIFEMPALQLAVLSAIGLSFYFLGSNVSYEVLLGVLLCGSVLIGGFEHARKMYNKLWEMWMGQRSRT